MRKERFLNKITTISVFIWLACIVGVFAIIGYVVGIRKELFDKTSDIFVFLLLSLILLGFLAFLIGTISLTAQLIVKKSQEKQNIFIFITKLIFAFAILPLYLLFYIIRKFHTKRFLEKVAALILVGIIILPIWVGGYALAGLLAAEQLGYITRDINIVGTGSMYPTWPKGTKGKNNKELAKEIISTAGFLPYPNGIVLSGRRFFGHTLDRGDIISWENNATRELTSQDGGEPAGLLKRLIGLPGDAIELKDGIVYLNGKSQKEPYIAKPHSTFGEKFLKECQPITVPEGKVFAMGDNRKGSADSREIGFVPIKDIDLVLPLAKQKSLLDKNWHDASNDLNDSAKPKIDKAKFIALLNKKRKEKEAIGLKYQPKLEKSAFLRGQVILKYNDFEQKNSYTMERSMAEANYWNSYWWEVSIQGYYEAEELIEDYLERDWTDAKETWFDKKFDDIGIAEVEGELNNCPTQVIVIHVAGYIPATYDKKVVDSWRTSVDNLNSIIPSWENVKGKGWINEEDLSRLLNLLYKERIITLRILSKMDANQWLTSEDNNLINEYEKMSKESTDLANKLNKR